MLYLYDLPRWEISSVKIAEAFKEKGIKIEVKPQIKRYYDRPFYNAILEIKDDQLLKKAA